MFSLSILLIFLLFSSASSARNDTLIFEYDVFCGYPNSTLNIELKEYDYLTRNDPFHNFSKQSINSNTFFIHRISRR
ncbi:unnamed protein product [Caenorhabditis angaria]|uniref:Uncharacterized protein n=1 Tax=Caenorhabditis angaria TaxID=860376 RepID=A0A9P1INJ9_9PELO|nr:unnamed protein product [Caenorhabditis angaria]